MHQITVIEPKWLSEVAPTFFRVADMNKISKRKQGEKIEPLYDRFAADKDDWVSLLPLRSRVYILTSLASQQTGPRCQVVADFRSGFITLVIDCCLCCIIYAYITCGSIPRKLALAVLPFLEELTQTKAHGLGNSNY